MKYAVWKGGILPVENETIGCDWTYFMHNGGRYGVKSELVRDTAAEAIAAYEEYNKKREMNALLYQRTFK
jgi:hypothetical protein